MVTPYIVTSNGLTTIDLGKVVTEEIQLVNKISKFSFPTQSTAATLSVNLFGKLRTISIMGIYVGTEAEQNAFVTSVEAWANSGIQTSRIYHDSLSNSYYVMCIDFNFSRKTDTNGRLIYNMVMLESGTT